MKMITKSLLAATALMSLPSVAQAAVVVSNVVINVPNTIDGIYINVVTGATGTSGAAVSGWDFNPYNNNAGLTFYGTGSPYGILATGTPGTTAIARDLAAGTVIGSAGQFNQFQTLGTLFQTAGNHVLGFSFLNEATGQTNYGYARITTSTGTGTGLGFPATITQLVYENSGAALTVAAVGGAVPEPATWGMMILGFGMIGAAARKRSVKTTVKFA
ncbi:hypothetical protein ASG11_12480 [Sphingomonas sp. Leaf357]|uniref:PEPxxWA-CTERM sorting domain-containing protein n=1 Tax=Sphingomonas sp. Leaf357 TaxID=1736350 RepID=UPI0006F2699E|nr:PEPxxWA-CTERM sorting domain-containing protein [Sphingomonas sp. Leaf357]KQS04966.1 hypothetical protein ASG11_12480 [Sphingomonas sp. Leaf357]